MAFSAGQVITADDLNAVTFDPVVAFRTTGFNTAGTTYAKTAGVNVAFVAPANGKIFVTVSGVMLNTTAGQDVYGAPQIETPANVVVHAADDHESAFNRGLTNDFVTVTRRVLITGLTPFASLVAHFMSRHTGGTGFIDEAEIIVEPAG